MTAKKPASNDEILQLKQQLADLTEALKRERADAVNAARRHEQQLASASQRAKASVVKQLLPVIDNFERSLKHVPKELAASDFTKGIEAVVKQFEKSLSDLGVSKIKTVNQPFDPNLHEAVQMEDGDGDQEIVSDELQAGYQLGGEVIRHAMVRVKRQ